MAEQESLHKVVKELAKALPESHCDKLVGQRIAARRQELGLSQRQLAFPHCSAAYISRIEAGQRRPSLEVLLKLSLFLGSNPEYLAWGRQTGTSGFQKDRLVLQLLGVEKAQLQMLAHQVWRIQQLVR